MPSSFNGKGGCRGRTHLGFSLLKHRMKKNMILTKEKKALRKKKKNKINRMRYCLIISECLSMLHQDFFVLLAIFTHRAPPRVSEILILLCEVSVILLLVVLLLVLFVIFIASNNNSHETGKVCCCYVKRETNRKHFNPRTAHICRTTEFLISSRKYIVLTIRDRS